MRVSDHLGAIGLVANGDVAASGKIFMSSLLATVVSCGLMSNAVQAAPSCKRLVGAYLVTVNDSGGKLASRQVLTLSADGNAFVVDSGQGGVSGAVNPFTSEQGSWDCQPDFPTSATATLIDFSLPGSVAGGQTTARADYKITSAPPSKGISGTIDLRIFPLTGNPLVTLLPSPIASFSFTGEMIP